MFFYFKAMQPNRVQRKIPLRHAYSSHQLDSMSSKSMKFIHRLLMKYFVVARCPHNRFGIHCEYSCSQCISGTCNWRSRKCDCQSGFTGIFCNQTMVNGLDETHRCQLCHKGNTASCHMEVGRLFVLFEKKTET
jgi:hypothetical protein